MGINFSSLGAAPAAEEWTCSCGTRNTGAFCISCGEQKGAAAPAPAPVAPAPAAPISVDLTPAPGITPVQSPTGGITLDLSKGSVLDLTKRNPGLKHIKVGAGWDTSACGTDFDLDVSAFLLNANGKITAASDIVFFNNKTVPGVSLSGDNRTGVGEGDDETIIVDLDAISPAVQRVAFCVTIFDAQTRRQTFGMVNNSYVRLLDSDQNDRELCVFRLKEDGSTSTAMIFAELVRNGAEWEFKTIGEGKNGDLNSLAAYYQ